MPTEPFEAALSYFEAAAIRRFAPATPDMIANAEVQLGAAFPPSLRKFLQTSNGLVICDDLYILGVPQIGETPTDCIVDWSISYRETGAPEDLVVLIQDGSGNPFCLLANQRDHRGECAITKVDHETREVDDVIASSYERLLWFVITEMRQYHRPDGSLKPEDERDDEFDEDWIWYKDIDYCLEHDPDLRAFLDL